MRVRILLRMGIGKSRIGVMENWVDLEKLDVMKFARSIERDCQEAVKWERRKLQWILEEQKKAKSSSEAA
jgi:hypothetical protein